MALVAIGSIGAIAVFRDPPDRLEVARGPGPGLPDRALASGSWTVVPKESAGLQAGSSLDAVASDGESMLIAGATPGDEGWVAAIWRSDDGLHWQRVEHPDVDGDVHAIAVADGVALAVGSDGGRLGGGASTFVWRSEDDGRSWSEVAHGSDLFGPAAPEMGRPFVDGLLHQDGWWIAHGGAADGYAGIWVSRDGRRWRQTLGDDQAGGATIVAGAERELFAYWSRRGWFTSDPTSWGDPVDLLTPETYFASYVAEGATLAVGTSVETHADTVLMRSADGGRTWRTDRSFARQAPEAWLWTVDRAGQKWIVAGASGEPNRPAAWVSSDGDAWAALPAELAGSPGGTLSLVATAGDTTVVLGTAPELDRYYVLRSG